MNNETKRGKYTVHDLVRISVLVAIMLLLEVTGLGMIKMPGLEITLLMVPVIVGAIVMGPASGAILGGVFGCISFWECFGRSQFGAVLLGINPLYTFLVCVPTRILAGWLCGVAFKGLNRLDKTNLWSFGAAGLIGALCNTVLFMTTLCLCFYNTDYIQGFVAALGSANAFLFVIAFVGVNGLVEGVVCLITGAAIAKAVVYSRGQAGRTQDQRIKREAVRMLLALDVGNTHVVVGLMKGREVRRSFRIATRRDNAVGDYAVALSQLLELAEVNRWEVEQVIISSVVPPVTRALQGAARLLTGKEPLVVGGNVRCRVPVRIKRPETLGADLLTAAVGALDLYQPPLLLVDMGTATTVTVLDEQGAFRGGAILPGANLALSSLAGGTALLPDIPLAVPDRAIGDDTLTCMQSGCVLGSALLLDGLIDGWRPSLAERHSGGHRRHRAGDRAGVPA